LTKNLAKSGSVLVVYRRLSYGILARLASSYPRMTTAFSGQASLSQPGSLHRGRHDAASNNRIWSILAAFTATGSTVADSESHEIARGRAWRCYADAPCFLSLTCGGREGLGQPSGYANCTLPWSSQ
jgi:hypothetical protein